MPRFEQEALITIHRTAQQFAASKGKPIEHLTRSAIRNAMVDKLRKDNRRDRRFDLVAILPGEDRDDWFADWAPSPAKIAIESEIRSHLTEQVQSWLNTRPPS